MPRALKKGVDAKTAPITAKIVADIFKQVTKEGPYPDADDYAQMAEMLEGSRLSYRSEPLLAEHKPRAVEAARVLMAYLAELDTVHGLKGSLRGLSVALAIAEPDLRQRPAPHAPLKPAEQPWAVAALVAAETCNLALTGLGRPTGTAPRSLTVQFAYRAAQQMGFRGASPRGVHLLLKATKQRT